MAHVPAAERRQAFIEAAIDVIAEHGVAGATTRRIAEAADAPLASLHYCFQTKENLMLAAFKAEGALFAESLSSDEAHGLAEAAPTVLRSAATWFAKHPQFSRSQMDMYMWAVRQTDPPNLPREAYDPFFAAIATYLRSCLAPGDDVAFVDPLAHIIAALIDGIVLQGFAYGKAHTVRNIELAERMLASVVESQMATGQ